MEAVWQVVHPRPIICIGGIRRQIYAPMDGNRNLRRLILPMHLVTTLPNGPLLLTEHLSEVEINSSVMFWNLTSFLVALAINPRAKVLHL